MTPPAALPSFEADPWVSPLPGHWRRDFRLGEWLPGPLSPSFATWFLPQCERGFSDATEAAMGIRIKQPAHVLVNGWYFTNQGKAEGMARAMLSHGPALIREGVALATMGTHPERAERAMAEPGKRRYDEELLPAYRTAVAEAEAEVEEAAPGALVATVDRLAYLAGTLVLPMALTIGFAGKAEFALATFYNRHLRASLGGSHQVLLAGLVEPVPPAAHAVVSLDWSEPTASEQPAHGGGHPSQYQHLVAGREAAEQACRSALARSPKDLARFDEVLAIAQRWPAVREQMAGELTLGWPVLRRALLRLGDLLTQRGVVGAASDVFLLEREEITSLGTDGEPLLAQVDLRRARREAQALLSPPLSLGEPAGPWKRVEQVLSVYRPDSAPPSDDVLLGLPGSPGAASGRVRVVRDLDDFDKVQDGDVLVAPITAPAWTPLFTSVAAVVTDGGSVFAHASVIAREFGIPAVIGTGDATSRLQDGQLVTVDGDRGEIRVGAPR